MIPDLEEARGIETIPAPKIEVVRAKIETVIEPFWNF